MYGRRVTALIRIFNTITEIILLVSILYNAHHSSSISHSISGAVHNSTHARIAEENKYYNPNVRVT